MELDLVLTVIVFSWACASLMDAISFGKGVGATLNEIWHIVKAVLFGTVYFTMLYLVGASWYWYAVVPIICFVQHEILYNYLRSIDMYKVDDEIRIEWLEKFLHINW